MVPLNLMRWRQMTMKIKIIADNSFGLINLAMYRESIVSLDSFLGDIFKYADESRTDFNIFSLMVSNWQVESEMDKQDKSIEISLEFDDDEDGDEWQYYALANTIRKAYISIVTELSKPLSADSVKARAEELINTYNLPEHHREKLEVETLEVGDMAYLYRGMLWAILKLYNVANLFE